MMKTLFFLSTLFFHDCQGAQVKYDIDLDKYL